MLEDPHDQKNTQLNDSEIEVLQSIRIQKVIIPIVVGVLVIAYLFWRNFDPTTFRKIEWTFHIWIWVILSILFLFIRHLAYSTRLKILSEGAFSWRKCIELIFIWEFSAAVSPTSVGGSAVAVFALGQEKIGGAKSATIVLYTVVADTFFFLTTLPILFLIFGPSMIRPELTLQSSLDGWFYTFVIAYSFMFLYGVFFFYGLFINPARLKSIILAFTKIPFLRRFRQKLETLGNDFVVSSKEIKLKKAEFHIGVFSCTAIAWSMRFLLLNCLIIGIVQTTDLSFSNQFALFGRLESMFVIMAFSPTPGGAGFAEFVFGGFLSDYVPIGISIVVAGIWRLLTYYSYLLAGVIIVPNWIRKILNERKKQGLSKQ